MIEYHLSVSYKKSTSSLRGDLWGAFLIFVLFLSMIKNYSNMFLWSNQIGTLVLFFLSLFTLKSHLKLNKEQYNFLVLLVFFIFFVLLTTFIGIMRGTTSLDEAIGEVKHLLMGVLFFISLMIITHEIPDKTALWNAFLNASFLVIMFGYGIDRLDLYDKIGNALFEEPIYGRLLLGFTSPNELGAFIAIVSTALFMRGLFSSNKAAFFLNIIMTGMLFFPLTRTVSRGGLLGGILGLVLDLLFFFFGKKGLPKKFFVLFVIVIVVIWVIFIGDGFYYPLLRSYEQRVSTQGFFEDIRVDLIKIGIQIWEKSPILGLGMGGFYSEIGKAPHNDFINILTSSGILGIGLMILIFAFLILKALQLSFHYTYDAYSIFTSLLVFISQEFFFNYLSRPKLIIFFWFMAWLVISLSSVDQPGQRVRGQ